MIIYLSLYIYGSVRLISLCFNTNVRTGKKIIKSHMCNAIISNSRPFCFEWGASGANTYYLGVDSRVY